MLNIAITWRPSELVKSSIHIHSEGPSSSSLSAMSRKRLLLLFFCFTVQDPDKKEEIFSPLPNKPEILLPVDLVSTEKTENDLSPNRSSQDSIEILKEQVENECDEELSGRNKDDRALHSINRSNSQKTDPFLTIVVLHSTRS
jgi:hypothetical protein